MDDLVLPVRAFDLRRDELVMAFLVARIDPGMEQDLLARGQPLLQLARLAERDHEAERFRFGEAADVPPAHESIVLLPPGAALVGRIGDDARRAQFADGEIDDRAGLARGEHQLAAHVPARIVGRGRAGTDVDETRRHIGRQAVLRERQRHRFPVAQPAHPAGLAAGPLDLPEFGGLHAPHGPRLLRPEHRLAVGGVAQDLDGVEAVIVELLLDMPRRGHELLARAHAMLHRNRVEVSFCRFAGRFRGNPEERRFVDELPEVGMSGRARQ